MLSLDTFPGIYFLNAWNWHTYEVPMGRLQITCSILSKCCPCCINLHAVSGPDNAGDPQNTGFHFMG